MKKFLLSFLCFLLAVAGGYAEDVTLSFANKAQRTSFSKSQQVWKQNGITFTNNKASSTTDVADYAKPVRLYQNSEIVVECTHGAITKIVFDCNSSSYATELKNSIGDAATVSSDKVTVNLDGTSISFKIAKLTKQVRLDALTVTYTAGATKPVAPTLTAGGNFVASQKIAISCDTEGATIYYTTDESEPTESSEIYDDPFEINITTTVKAVAVNAVGSSDVVTATYTRVAAAPTITFDGVDTYTIEPAEGTAIYYTLDGSEPNNNSDECPETIALKADATLKVIAYEGEYKSDIVEQKFTLASSGSAESSTGTASLVTDAADLKAGDQVVIVASDYNYALSMPNSNGNNFLTTQISKTENSPIIELNNAVTNITLEKGEVTGTYTFKTEYGYLYAPGTENSKNNYLKVQDKRDSAGSWEISIVEGVATIVSKGKTPRNTIKYNDNSNLFSCYASGQSDVSLYKVNTSTIEDPVLNVTPAGWATLYLGYNVKIPEGVTCYVVSEVGEESVKLEEVTDVLPANTAVIVKADEGDYEFKVTDVTATAVSPMKGSVKNEYITEEAYVLGWVDGKVGLYKAEMMGGVFLNNANKAYLPATAVQSNANALKFNFDTTGVEGVKVETAGKKVIYDLSGRRVNEMAQPGIYIINGKKVMVK